MRKSMVEKKADVETIMEAEINKHSVAKFVAASILVVILALVCFGNLKLGFWLFNK